MGSHSCVNISAACLFIQASSATIGCVVAMTNPVISVPVLVALGILAAIGTAVCIASIKAWNRTNSGSIAEYHRNFKHDFVGVIKFIPDSLFKAAVNGYSRAVSYCK